MVCKRRMYPLRSHKWRMVLVGALLFVGIVVTYNTLTSHDASTHLRTYLPSYENNHLLVSSNSHRRHSWAVKGEGVGVRDSVVKKEELVVEKVPLLNSPWSEGKQVVTHSLPLASTLIKRQRLGEVLEMLYPKSWHGATPADEMALILKDRLLGLNLGSSMSCADLARLTLQGTLYFSPRKYIDRLNGPRLTNFDPYYNHRNSNQPPAVMVMKSQRNNFNNPVRSSCLEEVEENGYDLTVCEGVSNYLLMRELFLHRVLSHPNLIALLGYCLRGDGVSDMPAQKGLLMVMEMGMPFLPSMVNNLPWGQRVRLAHDVASLLAYLEDSPVGSVGLPGVKPKDFVLVQDKVLKLTDLDDAQLDDRACSSHTDCFLENVHVGVQCIEGQCRGLNEKTNLRMLGGPILFPLLQNTLYGSQQDLIEETLDRVRHLNITSAELLAFTKTLMEKYNPQQESQEPAQTGRQSQSQGQGGQGGNRGMSPSSAAPLNLRAKLPSPEQSRHYVRVDGANFPSQYDFVCPGSRVTWGCVLVVQNLQAAMQWCLTHFQCLSFVVFSTNPDDTNKIAVVFKNGNADPPKSSSGTTLFLLKDSAPRPQSSSQPPPPPHSPPDGQPQGKGASEVSGVRVQGQNQTAVTLAPEAQRRNSGSSAGAQRAGNERDRQQARGVKVVNPADPWAKVKETEACLKQGRDAHEDSLLLREKRIMSAIGMKGTAERDWRQAVQSERVRDLSQLKGVGVTGGAAPEARGGSMLVTFSMNTPGHQVSQAIFMAERGPRHNHVAFAMLYALDRLLGLYHVVPTVEGFLRSPMVIQFFKNQAWKSVFEPLTHPDGTLRGLYVAKTPDSLTPTELSVRPLDAMTSDLTPLTKTQRRHLEYVVLLWMTYLAHNNTHMGVKGQLLHIEGDLGFQDLGASYEGFLYHCQFPALAHTALQCFRCNHPSNPVCSLGQQVVRVVTEAGFQLSHMNIPRLKEQDYPQLINTAASQIMQVIDVCIQKFGRDRVLY